MTQGFTVWFTGLPSSGKSTLSRLLKPVIEQRGLNVNVFDGDEVREHLSKGLGFSKQDRDTNIRRIAYVSGLVTRHGGVAITGAISPYRELRQEARRKIGRFVEVFVHCPVEECIERDVKGLYEKALKGEIENFTGISDPYEEPLNPEVVVNTHLESEEESLAKIVRQLEELGYLPAENFRGMTNVSIPTYLYVELGRQIGKDDSADVSRYITRLLAPTIGEPAEALLPGRQRQQILERLRELNYIH